MEVSDDSDSVIETLRSRGWCFGDVEQVKAVIMISSALADDPSMVVDSVESELLNMDLCSFGGAGLPDPSTLKKSSHLLGPKVLQISAVRDVSRSSVDTYSRNSIDKRLLRLGLTDGITQLTAIEFSHIPSISEDTVPGTKVRLENKVPIHSGIVCLNSRVLTVLGGVVQTLHEEWQMNQKYSGLSRPSVNLSHQGDDDGPPPFEKLQIVSPSEKPAWRGKSSDYRESSSKSGKATNVSGQPEFGHSGRKQESYTRKADRASDGMKTLSGWDEEIPTTSERRPGEDYRNSTSRCYQPTTYAVTEFRPPGKQQRMEWTKVDPTNAPSSGEREEDKPSSSETRPKEVAEAVPVQNQEAAQKLLQKMSQKNGGNWHPKGRRYRMKGREEDPEVLTLGEYEKMNAGPKQLAAEQHPDISRDEALAWQLQNELDLEDNSVEASTRRTDAEDIKMAMFNYDRGRDNPETSGHGERGRGKGRGQGQRRKSGGGGGRGWGSRRGRY